MQKKYFNSAHAALHSGLINPVLDLVDSGNDRDCWRMAENHSLCIKIAKPEQERPQNEIDYHYAKHLAKKGIQSVHMPTVYGWQLTDKGVGLVFDLVLDMDGQVSKQIIPAIKSGLVDVAIAKEQVDIVFAWLIEKRVILGDYGIKNLLVQNYAPDKFRVVIVDGLGARNFGWRYFLNRTVTYKAVIKAREFRQMTHDLIDKALTN